MPALRLKLVIPLLLALALAAGCDDDGNDEPPDGATPTSASPPTSTAASATATTAAPTSPSQATPTSPSPPTPPPDIRLQDLTQQPALQDFLATMGGGVQAGAIIYADLTGDGVEDAVVPVSSGGTLGDIAVLVFGYTSDGLSLLLEALPTQSSSIHAELDANGVLVTEEGVFGPGDPGCCPSEVLRRYYRWDGSALVVDREEQAPAQ